MKKILVLMALTMLLILAVAGPAVASTPKDGIYVWPWDGGSWVQASGGEFAPPEEWQAPGTPIPSGEDVYIGGGWYGYTRGLIKSLPNYLLYKLNDAADLESPLLSYKMITECWGPVEVVEDAEPAFNPSIGAKAFARDLFVPLAPFATGEHQLIWSEKFKHTTTDLIAWEEGQWHPYMIRAGVTEYPFVIVIGD